MPLTPDNVMDDEDSDSDTPLTPYVSESRYDLRQSSRRPPAPRGDVGAQGQKPRRDHQRGKGGIQDDAERVQIEDGPVQEEAAAELEEPAIAEDTAEPDDGRDGEDGAESSECTRVALTVFVQSTIQFPAKTRPTFTPCARVPKVSTGAFPMEFPIASRLRVW